MATRRIPSIIRDLDEIRADFKHFVRYSMPRFSSSLLKYADELDSAYRDIKISKVSGLSGCVVGGVLSTIGFGLSFATFGASFGLCIAGGVLASAGGIVKEGATIAERVKSIQASKKAEAQLKQCNTAFNEILKKCENISSQLNEIGDIDVQLPSWSSFWREILPASGKTVLEAVLAAMHATHAFHKTPGFVPLFRTLGKAAKVSHFAGGVIAVFFIPIDIFFLISESENIDSNKAHAESKKIRKAVATLQERCPSEKDIDDMIDACIKSLRRNF